jgi:RNA polymerase subunit RPABC4/transcription elongation factor Spt4
MTENAAPERWECPGCGSPSFTAEADGTLVCDYCHAEYVVPGRVCLECGEMGAPDARYCPACGAELVRECRACGAVNPSAARQCAACGRNLDMLDALFARVTGEADGWLQEVREEAPVLKAQQEAESQARLTEMWTAEAHRQETLAQARAERDRQERLIITATAVFVALVVIVVLVVVVITVSGTRNPCVYPLLTATR